MSSLYAKDAVGDLVLLSELTEAEIVNNLKQRHRKVLYHLLPIAIVFLVLVRFPQTVYVGIKC
jgi:hypothetical protein